jgi:hypothetical protein
MAGEEYGKVAHHGDEEARQIEEVQHEEVRQEQERLEKHQQGAQRQQARRVRRVIRLDANGIVLGPLRGE